jgi:hypothetical protein
MQTVMKLIEADHKKATENGSLEALCALTADLQQLKRSIDTYEADLTDRIAEQVEYEAEVAGRVVQVKRGKDRTAWDHDSLFRLALARSRDERLVDEETGVYEDPGEAALRVIRELVGVSYWKKTGLKARGIEIDEFCETKPGKVRVVFP